MVPRLWSWLPAGIGPIQTYRAITMATPAKTSAISADTTQRRTQSRDPGASASGPAISRPGPDVRTLFQTQTASIPAAMAMGSTSVRAWLIDQVRGNWTRTGRLGTPTYQSLKTSDRAPAA